MIRKIIFSSAVAALLFSCNSQPKERYEDILLTKDIKKIENFLKTSHPDDPRVTVLKPKLIALKNEAWTKGAKNAKPMEARPIVLEIPNSVFQNPNSPEAQEFKKLIMESSKEHSEKTVKLLNAMFDNDISTKEAILMMQNNSDCNLIVRISGKKYFNLAVPAHGQNSLVLPKDNYSLTSNVCGIPYSSQKNIQRGIFVILNSPTVK